MTTFMNTNRLPRVLVPGTIVALVIGVIIGFPVSASATPPAYPNVSSTVSVGYAPSKIIVGAQGIYVINSGNSVSIIDPLTNQVTATLSLPSGSYPVDATVVGDFLYVVNQGSDSVAIFNTLTLQLVRSIPVGFTPKSISLCGAELWVASYVSDNLSVISTSTNQLSTGFTNPISLGENGPSKVLGVGNKVYVANSISSSVSVLDCTTHQIITTASVSGNPVDLVDTPDDIVIVMSTRARLWLMDKATDLANTELSTFGLTVPPFVLQKVGGMLYVAGSDNIVTTINIPSNSYTTFTGRTYPLAAGTSPSAATARGTFLFFAGSANHTVQIFDTTTNSVTSTLSVGNNPVSLATSGRFVYVANQNDDTVSIIELEAGPAAPAVSPTLAETGNDSLPYLFGLGLSLLMLGFVAIRSARRAK